MPVPSPHRLASSAALTLAAALACSGPTGSSASEATGESEGATTGPKGTVALIDVLAWEEVDAADDPLASHRPDPFQCPFGGIYVETTELELDTNLCNYAMVRWPALVDVAAGGRLTLSLRHYDLTAAAPASAHLALLAGPDILWERMITIPGPAEVIVQPIELSAPIAAGTPIYLHLHNHGQNNYILTSVSATPP